VESLVFRPGDQILQSTMQFGTILDRAFLFCREAMKRPNPNVPRETPMRDIPVNLGFSSGVLEAIT
jgi:hypothetical protein